MYVCIYIYIYIERERENRNLIRAGFALVRHEKTIHQCQITMLVYR